MLSITSPARTTMEASTRPEGERASTVQGRLESWLAGMRVSLPGPTVATAASLTTRVTVRVVPLPIPTLIDAAGTVPGASDELADGAGDRGATEGDDDETCGGDPDRVALEAGDTHATTKAPSRAATRSFIVM